MTPNLQPSLERDARSIARFVGFLAAASLVPVLAAAQDGTPGGGNLSLVGQLTLPGAAQKSDVWGWVEPNTNKEYAFVGEYNGTNVYIIDVSVPSSPVLTKTITNTEAWDLKTYQHYLYTVDGDGSGIDGKIFDISDPANPVLVGFFPSAHNIFIDDQGYLYNSVPGTKIFNLNPNPAAPAQVWYDNRPGGHDVTVVGNRMYDFHGGPGTFIYDATNRAAPVLLGSIAEPNDGGIAYHHSGWSWWNEQYLFINDELALDPSPDITVWDISNPATPSKVGFFQDSNATIHNCYRLGNFLYASYYVAGVRVFDATNPLSIFIADEYDTAPSWTGEYVFEGSWGVYPFAPSKNIYASDGDNGIFVFSFTPNPTGVRPDVQAGFALEQNVPNPFNPTTRISYRLPSTEHVTLAVYDVRGGLVRTLVDERQNAGPQSATWNGRDDGGRPVATGVYFYRLKAGAFGDNKRMILLK